VKFPLKGLDLTPFVHSRTNDSPVIYDLFGVANHYGYTAHSGHYTAFCKNPINNNWYNFDDHRVTQISDLQSIVSEDAYVLFYQRRGFSGEKLYELLKTE